LFNYFKIKKIIQLFNLLNKKINYFSLLKGKNFQLKDDTERSYQMVSFYIIIIYIYILWLQQT